MRDILEELLNLVWRQNGLFVRLVDAASKLGDRLVVRDSGGAPVINVVNDLRAYLPDVAKSFFMPVL
jgi:hypothetical protein